MERHVQLGIYASVLIFSFFAATLVALLATGRLQAAAAGYLVGVVVAAGGALSISRG